MPFVTTVFCTKSKKHGENDRHIILTNTKFCQNVSVCRGICFGELADFTAREYIWPLLILHNVQDRQRPQRQIKII